MNKRTPILIGLSVLCMVVLLGCSSTANLSASLVPIGAQAVNFMAPIASTGTQPVLPQASISSKDPILFINGDLVSGTSLARSQKVVALIQSLMAKHPGTQMLVASAGDNEQENSPTLADYQKYFGTTYGVFVRQGIFRPIRGNHDVQDAGHGQAYASYFKSATQLGKIKIDEGVMNYSYSYNLGAWHIVAIDQLAKALNKTSLAFLQSDLAKYASTKCQLVYWHVPSFSSGFKHGDDPAQNLLVQAEYKAGVDIQVNGHDHDYQRFYPLNPTGQRDNAKGITTFVAGIGGQDGNAGSKTSIAQAASAVYMGSFPGGNGNHAIGVLQLTLHATSASYALYDANNSAILDQGNIACH
jgi:hypothetical protein